jgi:hypothetical protein
MAAREFDPSLDGAVAHLTRRAGSVATELRRRRELLGISQVRRRDRPAPPHGHQRDRARQADAVAGRPSARDWGCPAGRSAPPTSATRPHRAHLRRLAACAVVAGGAALGNLALALRISIPAVREGLSVLGERFIAVGLMALSTCSDSNPRCPGIP